MEPEFREGEIVIVNPHVEAKSGDYEEASFRQRRLYFSRFTFHDSRYLLIVGKVVKKEKRY